MSYGAKYYGSFEDYYDRTVLITIYEKDYSGASSEMKLAGAAIEYNGSDQNIYEPVMSSGLTVNIISETNFQYIGLYTANARKYKIIVTIDTVTHWTGYLVPDMFNEPYTCTPYISQIVATDGLRALESEDFDLSELHTQFEILQHILDKIDDLNIKDAINIYEENHNYTTGDTPLKQTLVDCEVYAEMNCYEVLLDILNNYGARIYQKGGEWWIVSVHEFAGELTYRDSDGGTDDTYNPELIIGYDNNDKLANVDQQLNILPGWKKFSINRNLTLRESFIENYDFQSWSITGYYEKYPGYDYPLWNLDSWRKTATVNKSYSFDKIYAVIDGGYDTPDVSIYQIFSGWKAGNRKIKFKIRFATYGSSNEFWIKIQLQTGPTISLDTKYYFLQSDGSWSEEQGGRYINIENMTQTPTSSNSPSFDELDIISDYIPDDGTLSIHIYAPKNTTLILDECRATILTQNFEEYPEELDYEKVININNNYISDEIELRTADLPDYGNNDTKNPTSDVANERFAYKGGFYLSNGDVTKQWQTRAEIAVSVFADADQLHKIVSKTKEFLSIPQWALTGSILGQNLVPDMCIVDYGVSIKKYLFTNGVFDLQSAQTNGTFIEIGSYSGADWILEDGTWNDDGIWIDDETWNDTDPTP